MDDHLDQFAEDLGMSPSMFEDTKLKPLTSHQAKAETDHKARVDMALEVNTMKQKSVQLFSKSQKKQRALTEQISLDRYMDQQGQIEEV